MRTAGLASVAEESDYVDAFQALLLVQKRLHAEGPKVPILIEEANAFLNLGDAAQCVARCDVVLAAHPDLMEARYLRARGYILQALVQCGAATSTSFPSTTPARALLEAAADDLEVVADHWTEDEEVMELLQEVDAVLMDEEMQGALHAELGRFGSDLPN